jgi:hypothetical protein
MVFEAPEQDVAGSADAIRGLMGQMSNTRPSNIFVYKTRTINNPAGGAPFTQVVACA